MNDIKLIKIIDVIALLFIIVGALNCGVIAFFNIDILTTLFGEMYSSSNRLIYGIIGVSGIYGLTFFDKK